jgi:hypothetical protein
MTSRSAEPADLLDLKLLPAWVKEPAEPRRYERYGGEEQSGALRSLQRDRNRKRRTPNDQRPIHTRKFVREPEGKKAGRDRPPSPSLRRTGRARRRRQGAEGRPQPDEHVPVTRMPQVTIRFLPYSPAFENVVAQIKSGSVAYSLFALARLFLEKPVGYEVCLTARAESLYQLGDNGMVSADREFLERNAFRFAHRDFYKIGISETDPIKGNFSIVARCRLSGTLLGPTNHHSYQPQLRSLYEQRFSRRMSFAEYQRQIEIVSDSALVERWKEEARKVTTYTTLREENPLTFSCAAEAERHFRSHYLPGLIRSVEKGTIGGAFSRRLPHRMLNRAIEEAWARETRSPSNMMQELAGRFRQNGLHVFRHRRGMLFVSPIRGRAFVHEHAGVSPSVNAVLKALSGTAAISRRQLFEKLFGDKATEDPDPPRLALASDLRWLISEGYVIEFNDGSLDLPRVKARPQETVTAVAAETPEAMEHESSEPTEEALATANSSATYSPTRLSVGSESASS